MATFSDREGKNIQELLGGIEKPVRLVHFTQTVECEPLPGDEGTALEPCFSF